MPRFVTRRIEKEAYQITEKTRFEYTDWPEWLTKAWEKSPGEGAVWTNKDNGLVIGTREGVHLVTMNDYIIQGVKGELYPCKPDIFEQTYEPV